MVIFYGITAHVFNKVLGHSTVGIIVMTNDFIINVHVPADKERFLSRVIFPKLVSARHRGGKTIKLILTLEIRTTN